MREINNKRIFKIILSVIIVISLIIGGFAVYLSDYYHADLTAIEAFSAGMSVTKTVVSDEVIVYEGSESQVGFIFYPGGKVEYKAYDSLMMELASKGILCILLEMPFNLAVLDMNAADGIRELYPEIDHWYIGGHSLGGSIAASYAAKN
ncbi:MAG: lysophospholipase, partial [Clostridia bacterium]|nr:lysophospholipase [Clostridia bacterium]